MQVGLYVCNENALSYLFINLRNHPFSYLSSDRIFNDRAAANPFIPLRTSVMQHCLAPAHQSMAGRRGLACLMQEEAELQQINLFFWNLCIKHIFH